MNQHQPQGQPWITLQKALIILAVMTFFFGDNIYKQMRGESIFDTIYSYLTRTSDPAPARIGAHRWLPSSAIPPEMALSESKSNPNPAKELQKVGWISNQLDTYTNPRICETRAGLNKLALQAHFLA